MLLRHPDQRRFGIRVVGCGLLPQVRVVNNGMLEGISASGCMDREYRAEDQK